MISGPNPRRYERIMKKARGSSRDEATSNLHDFMDAVNKAREKYAITDVVVMAATFFEPTEGVADDAALCTSMRLGGSHAMELWKGIVQSCSKSIEDQAEEIG